MDDGGEADDRVMSRDAGDRRDRPGEVDDWLAEQGDLNWVDDPRVEDATHARDEPPEGAATWGRPGRGRSGASAETIARRRVVAGVVAAALVVVTVIAIVVAVSGGGSKPGPAAVAPTPPSAPQPATLPTATTTPSASPATPPVQTPPSAPSATLTVTLPASGKLSAGDSGAAVVALQKALAALGLKVGKPDGSFGPATQAAVVAFQTANGLTPDGVVGAATARALNRALAAAG
jgi:hypothetical protein